MDIRRKLLCSLWLAAGLLPVRTVNAAWTASGPGGGGALFSPSFHPSNPGELFLTCDMGGVYRSTNTGGTWTVAPASQIISSTRGKVQFTSTPGTLYSVGRVAGTGSFFPVKSVDSGTTWSLLPSYPAGGGFTHTIWADPASTQRLIIAEYDRIYSSFDGGTSWSNIHQPGGNVRIGGVFWNGVSIFVGTNKGLLVSRNSGIDWDMEAGHGGAPDDTGIFQLCGGGTGASARIWAIFVNNGPDKLDPWTENHQIADADFHGLYSTTAGNSSTAWAAHGFASTQKVRQVDAPRGSNTVAWAAFSESAWPTGYGMGIAKTTNAGSTWITDLWKPVDNYNVTTGYCGSGGPIGHGWNGSPIGLDVADSNANYAIFTGFGFPYITTDGGVTWKQAYVSAGTANAAGTTIPIGKAYSSNGLNVTTANQLHWLSPTQLFISGCDIGNQYSADSGVTWSFARNLLHPYYGNMNIYNGPVDDHSGNWYGIAATGGTLFAAISNMNDLYSDARRSDDSYLDLPYPAEPSETGRGHVLISTNGGQSWSQTSFNQYIGADAPVVSIATEPGQPNRVYACVADSDPAVDGVWRSENLGASWAQLMPPTIRAAHHPAGIRILPDGSLVVQYAASTSGGYPYASTDYAPTSGIFYWPVNGNAWLDRSTTGFSDQTDAMLRNTRDLVVDPGDPTGNTWYATVWSRYSDNGAFPTLHLNEAGGGLFRTIDRGATWTRIKAMNRAESVIIAPWDRNTLYLAGEWEGLHITRNALAETPTFTRDNSFPSARPRRLFFNPHNSRELWVTTMGGGVWKETVNLLRNGQFGSGTTAWALRFDLPGTHSATATIVNSQANPQVRLQPGSGAAAGTQLWHLVWRQLDLPLLNGRSYTVTYKAKTDTGTRPLNCTMYNAPFVSLGQQNVTLNATLQQFSFTFTSSVTTSTGWIGFNFGGNTKPVFLDDVSIQIHPQ